MKKTDIAVAVYDSHTEEQVLGWWAACKAPRSAAAPGWNRSIGKPSPPPTEGNRHRSP